MEQPRQKPLASLLEGGEHVRHAYTGCGWWWELYS